VQLTRRKLYGMGGKWAIQTEQLPSANYGRTQGWIGCDRSSAEALFPLLSSQHEH
jgi:hypothetical protein